MKRFWIYVVLFPPVVWLFLCAANRVNPFAGTMSSVGSTIAFAYAVGIVPALLTGLSHHLLKEKGYRSILSVFVGAATVPLVFAMFFRMDARLLFVSSVGGLIAAMFCWAVSRVRRLSR